MTLSEDFNGPVTLMAAYNDENEVLGVLAESQAGLFGRVAGGWITVTPNNRHFAGANVVDVDEDILDFFDKLDARGAEPSLKQVLTYLVDDEAAEPEAPEPTEEVPEETK